MTVASSQDLATKAVQSVAIADPATVPAGRYARAHLQRLDLWADVLPKVVPTENVRGALAAVEAGNVDAAIVYRTDAMTARRARVAYIIPADQAPAITYATAALTSSTRVEQAKAFLESLSSPAAREILERRGFVVPNRP